MNIKIHLMLLKSRIKQKIFDMLLYILENLDATQLKKALIGIKMSFNMTKIVPKDDKWHHIATTTECYIRRSKNEVQKKQEDNYYMDGVLVKTKKTNRRTK